MHYYCALRAFFGAWALPNKPVITKETLIFGDSPVWQGLILHGTFIAIFIANGIAIALMDDFSIGTEVP